MIGTEISSYFRIQLFSDASPTPFRPHLALPSPSFSFLVRRAYSLHSRVNRIIVDSFGDASRISRITETTHDSPATLKQLTVAET
jgi:hypothetical protein